MSQRVTFYIDGFKRYEIPEKWIPANIVKNSNM